MPELSRPFAAIRKDPKWGRKVLVAAVINLIPYVGAFIVIGWVLDYLRSVAWGDDEHLPEWSPLEPHLLRGALAFVGILPLSFLLGVLVTPLSFAMSGSMVLIPSLGETGLGLFLVITALSTLGSFATGFLIVPLTYSVYSQVALYERLEATFQYGEMWERLKQTGPAMRRAWLHSVMVSLASLPPMLLLVASMFLWLVPIFASGGDIDPAGALAWLVVSFALGAVSFVAIVIVGVFVGIAAGHYWGTWAREAYGLAAASDPTDAAGPGDAPPETP